MALAVIDRYRRSKRDLFVDIDNVVSRSALRVRRFAGKAQAYKAAEVLKDEPVPDAADALRKLRSRYFIRFLTARGSYEDAWNVTQMWMDRHNFLYDDLIVVKGPEEKLVHLTNDSLLID